MSSIYILFICIVAPLIMTTFFVDKKARIFIVFLCIGFAVCLLAGEINAIFVSAHTKRSLFFITVNITPVVEEILKMIPVLVYAFFISDDKETLINLSMITGIGFAILENTYMFLNTENATVYWALIRGLGAGFMHGLSTMLVGSGLSYIRKNKAAIFPGIIGLLSTASIFHGTYNAFVQSRVAYIGYCYPIVVFFAIKIISHAMKQYSAKVTKRSKSDFSDKTVIE